MEFQSQDSVFVRGLCCISPASSLEDWLILASTSSLNLNDSWPESGILVQPFPLYDIFSWADLIRQLEDILLSKSTLWNSDSDSDSSADSG